MDARDLLLDEHGRMHAATLTGDKGTLAERTFGGLTDDQMRARPREDLNSIAWILWHIARAEDIILNPVLAGRTVPKTQTARTVAANNIVNSGAMVIGSLMAFALSSLGVGPAGQLLLVAAMCLVSAWLGWKLHLACD